MRRHLAGAVGAVTSLGLAVAVPAAPAHAASVPDARSAHYVSGDFDGDGRVDLAVGAPGSDRVRVSYTQAAPGGSHIAFLRPTVSSARGAMYFGGALAIGDVNGDGRSDLAVGAPGFWRSTSAWPSGAIFVFTGSSFGLRARPLTMIGPPGEVDAGTETLGARLAAADVDGDGYGELATGGPSGLRVYAGARSGFSSSGYRVLPVFASSVVFGDVVGDRHPDLIAGAPYDGNTNGGTVTVFAGSASGLRTDPARTIRGRQVGVGELGTAVAVGDVNGDGRGDVLAGAALSRTLSYSPGSIVLLLGGAAGITARRHQVVAESRINASARIGDAFGSVLRLARLDGDRYADVVVGAPYENVQGKRAAGAVFLLHGSARGISLAHTRKLTLASRGIPGGVEEDAQFGTALFTARLNLDDHIDLAIGALGASYGAVHGGMVVKLRGRSFGISTRDARVIGGRRIFGEFGYCIR